MTKKIQPPNYTQIPNVILDEYMKDLSGSEIFVILAVSRQTFGWHKKRAKMSISFLMKATGLSNSAVIDACKSLMDKGILGRKASGQSYEYYITVSETYEKSSQPKNEEPVKKSHKTREKSSQVTREKSSHKERKSSKEKNTTTKKGNRSRGGSKSGDQQLDGEIGKVFDFYHENIGMITGYDSELIRDAVDEFGGNIVIEAIKVAVEANRRKWNYIDGILKNWRANGIKRQNKNTAPKPKTKRIIIDPATGQKMEVYA